MSVQFKCAAAELCMPVVPLLVQLATPAKKSVLPQRLKQAFKDYAIEDWCQRVDGADRKMMREALRVLEVHHILPRFLHGQHHAGNLALVESTKHSQIHDFINEQTRGMVVGKPRLIELPVDEGLVWGLNPAAFKRWRHLGQRQREVLYAAMQAPSHHRGTGGIPHAAAFMPMRPAMEAVVNPVQAVEKPSHFTVAPV
jgi:hypothetical protein